MEDDKENILVGYPNIISYECTKKIKEKIIVGCPNVISYECT